MITCSRVISKMSQTKCHVILGSGSYKCQDTDPLQVLSPELRRATFFLCLASQAKKPYLAVTFRHWVLTLHFVILVLIIFHKLDSQTLLLVSSNRVYQDRGVLAVLTTTTNLSFLLFISLCKTFGAERVEGNFKLWT